MPATRLSAAAICTLLWFGAAAGATAQDHDPDAKIAGGGTLPTGWHAKTDKNRPLADAKIQTMGTGLHATLGPAVILWRDRDLGAGKAVNELSITVRGGKVSFQVNGKDVYSADASGLDTKGIVGYRVNHNLDVHLSPLAIHKL